MSRDDPATGCGISRWWLTRPDDIFAQACDWHDKAYVTNSYHQLYWTRMEVDVWFLKLMKDVAKNRLQRARAYLYYYTARLLGSKYWEGNE